MLQALSFATLACGFSPRSALEQIDSGQNRLEKILALIESCDFGVHDISRTEVDADTGLPRFNMPFELGLYLGCKRFGGNGHAGKKTLVLDREPYRYRQFLSDLSGQDVFSHDGKIESAIRRVRDWLSTHAEERILPGPGYLNALFDEFSSDLPKVCVDIKLDAAELTFRDYCFVATRWQRRYEELSRRYLPPAD